MSTNYFKNFKFVPYSFGNREDPVLFNNLTEYVDIIDKIKLAAIMPNNILFF